MSQERPSKKQRELLSFIDGFIKGHGYGPSYREVMRALNYKSVSTVAIHINGLITKGHLQKRTHSARSLEVLTNPSSFKDLNTPVSEAQSKWLIDRVNAKFEDTQKAPTKRAVDELFVLVGALHILGLDEAHTALKSKLIQLETTQKTDDKAT